MIKHLQKYRHKLVAERTAIEHSIVITAQDDTIVTLGEGSCTLLAQNILKQLNSIALCIAKPALPFADLLIKRSHDEKLLVPQDTETRTFLHDIPIIRQKELLYNPAQIIAHHLGNRKGVVVEGIGIISVGALTVEQAYINWSSVFHATFIKYLEDILESGFVFKEERNAIKKLKNSWLQPLSSANLTFKNGILHDKQDILSEITKVGKYTVQQGLVDSFFGNISYSTGDMLYISQTASSLDELSGCIDPVPFDNSSTVGITASSELAAHRRIYETSGYNLIIHGHPRFAVILSMLCSEKNSCPVKDCWKDCKNVRYLGGTPVVAGEIGAGGLAKNVPPVIKKAGKAIVYGHGVFTAGKKSFKEAFDTMIEIETWCREEYFRLLEQRWGLQ